MKGEHLRVWEKIWTYFSESKSQALLLGCSLLLCSMRLVSWMIPLCDFFTLGIVPVACICFLLWLLWRFFADLQLCWHCLFFWIPLGLAFCEFIYDLLSVEVFQSCIQFCFLLGFPFSSLLSMLGNVSVKRACCRDPSDEQARAFVDLHSPSGYLVQVQQIRRWHC